MTLSLSPAPLDLEEALAAAEVGVFEADLTTRSVRGSPRFRALLSLPSEGPLAVEDLAPLLLAEDLDRLGAAAEEGAESFRFERRVHLRDGTLAWREVRGRARRAADGARPVRLAGVVLDREERARLEQQREELLKTLSHDLRTPLSTIQLQVQLLERTAPLGEAGNKRTRIILGASQRMNAMIQDLVDASRLESGLVTLDLRAVPVEPFLRELLERQAGALELERVRLELPAGLPPAHADPRRLERMVVHLLSNALRFSPPGSPVTVRAERAGEQLRLQVLDQGPGVPPEERPRIFERFFRGAAARAVPGLGLGLYLVDHLARAHRGSVQVGPAPEGGGGAFELRLPLAP